MKMTASTVKNYKPSYKKKTITTDPYLPKGASKSVSVCEQCHAVYSNKRWSLSPERYDMVMRDPTVTLMVCPACHKMHDDLPGGIVTLKGAYVLPHKQELLNLVKNEEERARGMNPLERVMSIKENGSGSLVINTTNERLAQRLGKAIKKAFHGEVAYHFSHDNKLARVDWERVV
jgi:NMD protein affecting ribosome stability and mRNA decay